MKNIKVEDQLLATHISNNAEFASACASGNSALIMHVVETEMKNNKLFTKGAEKLKNTIIRMLNGQSRVSSYVGQNVLMYVWNSRLAGTGLEVK